MAGEEHLAYHLQLRQFVRALQAWVRYRRGPGAQIHLEFCRIRLAEVVLATRRSLAVSLGAEPAEEEAVGLREWASGMTLTPSACH